MCFLFFFCLFFIFFFNDTATTEIYTLFPTRRSSDLLGLNGFENYELSKYCQYIRRTIKQWVGIPVSIGVSTTKTLSKIANNLAKKNKEYDGVCILKSWFDINEALKLTSIEDVWGIGRRLSVFLKKYKINTAYDFTQLDKGWIRKNMGRSESTRLNSSHTVNSYAVFCLKKNIMLGSGGV